MQRGDPNTEHIEKVVRERHSLLNGCYSDLMARVGTSVQGRVDVRFGIEKTGALEGACILETELDDQELSACVVEAFRGLRFEASADPVVVTYPVYFSLDAPLPLLPQPPLMEESR